MKQYDQNDKKHTQNSIDLMSVFLNLQNCLQQHWAKISGPLWSEMFF